MRTICYWAPCIDKVATIQAVKNSVKGINLYLKESTKAIILNSIGEWNDNIYKEINFYNLTNLDLFKKLPIKGFFKSRFTYIVIILFSAFPLFNYLNKKKPDYLIIHLLTSLPIILFIFFNFRTKLILRVSGLPKLNFFRKYLWKLINKKIHKVTCPTQQTLEDLKAKKIFSDDKLYLLYDPVIEVKEYSHLEKKNGIYEKNYLISVGRLTKQKNHLLLLKFFNEISNKYNDLKLIICGNGEDLIRLNNYIKKFKLENKIIMKGYVSDIKNWIKGAKCVISTSLWEDPGFVMIEAAMCNTFVISSNCPNGPKEFIQNDENGILFTSNKLDDLVKKFNYFMSLDKKQIMKKKINAKKKVKNYTIFSHTNNLNKILL